MVRQYKVSFRLSALRKMALLSTAVLSICTAPVLSAQDNDHDTPATSTPRKSNASTAGTKEVTNIAATNIPARPLPQLRYFQDLFSPDRSRRSLTLHQAREERSAKITELIEIVQTKGIDASSSGAKYIAIQMLGLYRAIEAIDVLAQSLTFLPDDSGFSTTETKPTQMYYPCVEALIQIGGGKNTVNVMLIRIALAQEQEERDLATWVIMKMQGKEDALKTLESQITSGGTAAESKLKLEQAQEYIRTYKVTSHHPRVPKLNQELPLSQPSLSPPTK